MPNPYVPKLQFVSTPEWHLARRVAIAPTQKLANEIKALGVNAWLDKQLAWKNIPDPVMDGLIKDHFSATEMTAKDYTTATGNQPWHTSGLLRRSIFLRHRYSERYLHDQMVEFFSDLIYISASGKSNSLVCDYNRAVLRPHALGKFSDMLHAALTHAALIVYLDNQGSTKTDPNENLGRELLELHTVGVGNYTEADVRNSTLLLTGHSFDWNTKSYVYKSYNHYVGPLKIMGFTHANSTAAGGPAVLKAYAYYLALHPATARRIATRLYTRFVEDIPPTGPSPEAAALISSLASTYLSSNSSMGPVLKKLFTSTVFKNSVGNKWRRPQETFATMAKGLGPNRYVPNKVPVISSPNDSGAYGWRLEKAGHMTREWPAVNGYPDVGDLWLSSNCLRETINAGEAFVWRWDKEVAYSQALKDTFRVKDGDNALVTARRLTKELTGFTWAESSIAVIASFLESTGMKLVTNTSVVTNVDRNLTFALRQILASPYFMVR